MNTDSIWQLLSELFDVVGTFGLVTYTYAFLGLLFVPLAGVSIALA
jgi:hypothetical protein